MCDGTYMYPTKGGASTRIREPIIIICGNKDPAEMYPNCYKFLEARFVMLCADGWPDSRTRQEKDFDEGIEAEDNNNEV